MRTSWRRTRKRGRERKLEEEIRSQWAGSEREVDWEKVNKMRQKEMTVHILSKEEIWIRRMLEDMIGEVVAVAEVDKMLTEDMEEFMMVAGLKQTKLKEEQPVAGPAIPEVQSVAGAALQEVQSVVGAGPLEVEVLSEAGAPFSEVQSEAPLLVQGVAGTGPLELQSVALGLVATRLRQWGEGGPSLKTETKTNETNDGKRKWAKARRGAGRKDGLVQQKLDMFMVKVPLKLQLTGEKKSQLKPKLGGQTEDTKTLQGQLGGQGGVVRQLASIFDFGKRKRGGGGTDHSDQIEHLSKRSKPSTKPGNGQPSQAGLALGTSTSNHKYLASKQFISSPNSGIYRN